MESPTRRRRHGASSSIASLPSTLPFPRSSAPSISSTHRERERPALSPRSSSLFGASLPARSPPRASVTGLGLGSERAISPTFDPHYPDYPSLSASSSSVTSSVYVASESRSSRRLTRSHPTSPTLNAMGGASKTFPSFSLDPHGPHSPPDGPWTPLPPLTMPLPRRQDDVEQEVHPDGSPGTSKRSSRSSVIAPPSTTSSSASSVSSAASSVSSSSRLKGKSASPGGSAKSHERRSSHASVSFGAATTRLFQKNEKTSTLNQSPTTTSASATLADERERMRSWQWGQHHRGAAPAFSSRLPPSAARHRRHDVADDDGFLEERPRVRSVHPGTKGWEPRRSSLDATAPTAGPSTSSHQRTASGGRGYRSSFSSLSSLFTPATVASVADLEDSEVFDQQAPKRSRRTRQDRGTRSAPASRAPSRRGSLSDMVGGMLPFPGVPRRDEGPALGFGSPRVTTAPMSSDAGAPPRTPSSSRPASRRSSLSHVSAAATSSPSSSPPPSLSQLHLPHLPVSLPNAGAALTPLFSVALYTFVTSLAALALASVMAVGFGLTAWDDMRKKVRSAGQVRRELVRGARGVVEGVVAPGSLPFRPRPASGGSTPTAAGARTPPSPASSSSSGSSWASRVLPHTLIEALTFVAANEARKSDGTQKRPTGHRPPTAGKAPTGAWTESGDENDGENEEEETGVETDTPPSYGSASGASSPGGKTRPGEDTKPGATGSSAANGGMPRPPWSVLFGSLMLTACIFVGRGVLMWWMERKREEGEKEKAKSPMKEAGSSRISSVVVEA